jgi:hypothetical protein
MAIRPEGLQAVTSGTSASVSAGVGVLIVNPASLLPTLAITLPASPADRDDLYILAGGTIVNGAVVTAFSVVGSVIGSIPTSLTAGVSQHYKYFQSIGKWYRIV